MKNSIRRSRTSIYLKNILLLTIILYSITSFSQDISGNWGGSIELDNRTIDFVFHIDKDTSGYTSIIDIPSQRMKGIKPLQTLFNSDSLIIDLSNVGMQYKGKFNKKENTISGKMIEGAANFTLNLSKNNIPANSTIVKRPQEPIRPFPYYEEEVSFSNTKSEITLSGTFTRPKEKGIYPTVILISGSGPQDRDETFSEHKPFLVLADYLTRKGIAVLRYDDRGFGKSTGNHSLATTYDFATDAMSAVDYLKTRNDVDAEKIGLIGHSEGGIIAPLVAADKDITFIISLAGTGISGTELSVMQSISMRGFPVPDENAYEKAVRDAIELIKQDKDIDSIRSELRLHYGNTIGPILKDIGVPETRVTEVINGLVRMRTTKWMRYFYSYNPADAYEKVRCPVLSLNGSLDTQVESKINQEGLEKALTKGGNPDFEIVELEGLNHLFQNASTGKMDEYSKIEETFSPKALALISNWIHKHI